MTKHLKVSLSLSGGLLVLIVASIILHNAVSALLGIEDALFFLLFLVSAFLFPFACVYLLIAVVMALVKKGKKEE